MVGRLYRLPETASYGEPEVLMESFAVKGDLIWTPEPGRFESLADGYITVEGGRIAAVSPRRPDLPVDDYSGRLIIPGLSDLHLHAPQYVFMGLYMDEELLQWLERHTFPIEAAFRDEGFAREAYQVFSDDLLRTPTTRISAFGTIFADTTLLLMDILDKAGFSGYVGKVNMDRNSPDILREATEESVSETLRFIEEGSRFASVRPIITPRFIPSCSDRLLSELGRIAADYGLPIQSHLDENLSEIEWVSSLCPDSASYADAYDSFSLLTERTIMAHCVWLGDDEVRLMKEHGAFVAHSPSSNINIASGIAPVRRYLDEGLKVGLATDVAGGSSLSLLRMVSDAVQSSKVRWRIADGSLEPLSLSEAFYLASKGGGSFFGKVGSFEAGYDADIAVIARDADRASRLLQPGIEERLESVIYRSAEMPVEAKYIRGRKVRGSGS